MQIFTLAKLTQGFVTFFSKNVIKNVEREKESRQTREEQQQQKKAARKTHQ